MQGEYIFLDADNRIRESYLEHGIRILGSNPQIGVVYGDAGSSNTNRSLDCWPVSRAAFDLEHIDACAVLRRCVWEQNQGYDGTMPIQGLED
jgi:hypothetical protein